MQRDGLRAALAYLVPLLISAAVLTALGLASVRAWGEEEGAKQGVFLLFGLAAMFAVQSISYRDLMIASPVLFGLSLLLVGYTVAGRFTSVPLVRPVNGAYAWIIFGPVSLQPAELTKISLVLLMAWIVRDEAHRQKPLMVMVKLLGLFALAAGLILQQPDLGTVMTMLPPVLAVMFLAGVKKRHFAGLLLLGLMAAPVLWFSGTCSVRGPECPLCPHMRGLSRLPQFVKHYQRARVEAMVSTDARVLQDAGYQQERAMEALGSGGLMGKGIGNIPAGRAVPEAHTDMIIALVGEQFGLMGVAIVLLAYGLLIATAVTIAGGVRDLAGQALLVGVTALLVGQAMLNLGVAMRLLPVTGVTLPFVSYGGSSLMASFAAIGLIANVARNQRKLMF